jgi:dCMP deaminase
MNSKIILSHLKVAEVYSQLSHAKRLKVGAIIVKDNRVISIGYNGTPSGWDNECEIVIKRFENGKEELRTKPEVIHAEANAIAKLARSQESGEDSDMFITHAPCLECAKLIYTAGIKNVYYREVYRDDSGLDFLNKCGIRTERVLDEKV